MMSGGGGSSSDDEMDDAEDTETDAAEADVVKVDVEPPLLYKALSPHSFWPPSGNNSRFYRAPPPRNFGWTWRGGSGSRKETTQTAATTTRRRRYNVCDAVTGRRLLEKQNVAANTNPPSVTATRIIHIDSRVVTVEAAATTAPTNHLIMAAGVLFYSQRPDNEGGDTLFLLGREQFFQHWPDSEKWADFGGGVDVVDEDITATAAREAWEESMGTIHTYEVLLNRLRNGEATVVVDIQANDNAGCYRVYLLRIPYFDYNMMLSRFRAYLRKHKIQILDAEKTTLEWIDSRHLLYISSHPESQGFATLRPNFAKTIVEIDKIINLHTLHHDTSSGGGRGSSGSSSDRFIVDEENAKPQKPA
jgi:hypothetical protein